MSEVKPIRWHVCYVRANKQLDILATFSTEVAARSMLDTLTARPGPARLGAPTAVDWTDWVILSDDQICDLENPPL